MTRRHIPLAHPRLVIAGRPWRHLLEDDGRIVSITLPIVNFGRDVPPEPTIMVSLTCQPRGRHVAKGAE